MLKGFAITPVVLGRIAIGTIVENKGKKLPMKLDYMMVTSNVQKDGGWIMHPVASKIADAQKGQIRSLPIRILFDKPELNFRAEYSAFNDKARLLCSGNGDKAHRLDPQSDTGMSEFTCPGSDLCAFGKQNRCKPFGRLLVGLEGAWDNDPLSGFMFRTTSYNSIRALTARLEYLAAASGGMGGMPCNLVMRSKSTSASMRRPIYYLDIEPRDGLLNAMAAAKTKRAEMEQAGFNRAALEEAVQRGYAQSAFVESDEDGPEVVTEFFNNEFVDQETGEVFSSNSVQQPGDEPVNQPNVNKSESERQAGDVPASQKETQTASEKPFKDMTDEELMAQVDPKQLASMKNAINRIPNLQDETSISGARMWNSTRFGENTAAMTLIERHFNKQLAKINGNELPLEGDRKTA